MADDIRLFGPFLFDHRRKVLSRNGSVVPLGQKALALLDALLAADGRPVSKDDLLQAAWQTTTVEESNLTVQIAALRKGLGIQTNGDEWIVTVPRLGYRLSPGPAEQRPSLNLGNTLLPVVPKKPSIAVLPFVDLSGEANQGFIADGLTEDIIAALSRIREFFVISRTTSSYFKGKSVRVEDVARDLGVRHVLEGSVRAASGRIRVTVNLIDGETGHTVWSEKYDGRTEDIFSFHDDITRQVALALQVKLSYGELARLWEGQTKSLRAWEMMAQGRDHFLKFNPISNREAQAALREALAIDPSYTGAMVQLGLCHWWQARYDYSVDREQSLVLCDMQIERALEIDPNVAGAHMLRGGNAFLRDQFAEAVAHCERAVQLAPSDSWAAAYLGLVCTYAGNAARAVEVIKIALRLSPYPPHWYIESYATANLWHGDLATALLAAEENYRLEPTDMDAHLVMALTYGFAGRRQDAERVVKSLRNHHPSFTLKNVRRSERYAEPEKQDKVVAIMRDAGLPD